MELPAGSLEEMETAAEPHALAAPIYRPEIGEDIAQQLRDDGIRYGISVGRRQPMHQVHLDCIREIVAAGLQPVIVIGSANGAGDRFFDPLKNPLNAVQQREQIRRAMEAAGIANYQILAINDVGHVASWARDLSALMNENGVDARQSVFHFRGKASDREAQGAIVTLNDSQEMLQHYGFSLWESRNADPALDAINATPFRTMDVNAEENQAALHDTLVTSDYIRDQANRARAENPDKALLAKLPVTMLDISLQRLRLERGIATTDILRGKPAESLDALQTAIATLLNQPSVDVVGSLATTPDPSLGANHEK